MGPLGVSAPAHRWGLSVTVLAGWLLVVALAAGGGPAPDDENDPAPVNPDPVVEETVEVRAEAPDDEDVAAFSTTIDGDELAESAIDLADVLRRVPGARIRDYGGLGSYATVSLRASTPEQVVVLVDGVPRNRALGGAVDLSSIPASQIESVTVYRGFAPASLGPAGIGGVVDVRTRDGAEGAGGRIDVVAGELGTARVSAGWTLPTGPVARLTANASGLRSDGDFRYLDTGTVPDFDPDDDVVLRRANNELGEAALSLRWLRTARAGAELALGLRAHDRERGVPGPDGQQSDTAELDESRRELSGSFRTRVAPLDGSVEISGHAFREDVRFRDPAGLRATDARTVLDGGGLAAVLRSDRGRHHGLVRADAGVERADSTDRALDASDRGGVRRVTTAATVEDLLAVGRVALAPSVRWERRDDEFVAGAPGIVGPPATDLGEDELSGKIGAALALGPRWTMRGSAGSFFRPPSLVELFGDRGALRGNPRLASERGRAIELGVARRTLRQRLGIEAVGFARKTDDLIVLEPQSQGVLVPRNLAQVEVAGIELDLSARVGHGLRVDAALTLQDPRDTSGGGDEPLPFEPDELAWLGASWIRGRLAADWEVTHVGSNAFEDERITARTIHDARLSWDAGSGVEIGLDVRNVFDRMTRDVARHPLPDRVVSFHVGWRSGEGGS
jgi:iron complex outermembrane receptor protein